MKKNYNVTAWTRISCWQHSKRFVSGRVNKERCCKALDMLVEKAKQNNLKLVFVKTQQHIPMPKQDEMVVLVTEEVRGWSQQGSYIFTLAHCPHSHGGSWFGWDNCTRKQCNQVTIE